MSESQRKSELRKLLVAVLENSTIIPFRWFYSKFMCLYCGSFFCESSKLKVHMNEEHQGVTVTKIIRSSLSSCKIKLDVSDIKCKLCLKKVETFDDFLTHLLEIHDFKINTDIGRSIFVFKLDDERLSCCYCGENFKFFASLLKHIHKYHNTTASFVCEVCGQGFVRKEHVANHVKQVHETTGVRCSKCYKIFPNISVLNEHKNRIHKERLKCSKCSEVFSSMYKKQRHLALVHDEKELQYACDQCPRVFTKRSVLVNHKSRVHLKEKTVACDICGFKVFNKELLACHMVRHNDSRPFECRFCKKTFQRKKGLDFHTRIHTNDKRYVCKICEKAFVQVTSLKLHLRVHHSLKESVTRS